MKLDMDLKITINSGAALLIFALGFFLLVLLAGYCQAIERIFPVALGGWAGAFAGFLVKRNANNKNAISLETVKSGCRIS